jgi:hypothetical protein
MWQRRAEQLCGWGTSVLVWKPESIFSPSHIITHMLLIGECCMLSNSHVAAQTSHTMLHALQVAMAQAQHIAMLTEQHLEQYHQAVLTAQKALALREGMDVATLSMTPEELERQLEQQAKEEG